MTELDLFPARILDLFSSCRYLPPNKLAWRAGVSETLPPAISHILANWSEGDREAPKNLIPLIYDDLRRVAHQYLRKARPGHTLQTTALVHEAYLRLEQYKHPQFRNQSHFLAICALLMRQILIGYERRRRAAKRSAAGEKLALDDVHGVSKGSPLDLLALDDALNGLARLNPQQSRIVELRFFGGMSIEETAEAMNLSVATVKRHWSLARLWLHHEMSRESRA